MAGAFLCASTGTLPAQNAPSGPDTKVPEALIEARTLFFESVLGESKLLTEQFARALGKSETEAAAAANYNEALRIQTRRKELAALYEGGTSSLVESESITLNPEAARLGNGTEFRLDHITGWRSVGSFAEWSGVAIPAGDYYLNFEAVMVPAPRIGSGLDSRGSVPEPVDEAAFEFFEVSLLQGATDNRRGFDVKPTADGATYASYRIGPIAYSRSPVTLRLAAVNAYPLNIIRFRNLRLVPVEAGVEVAEGDRDRSGEGWGLDEGRAELKEALEKAFRESVDEYVSELRSWSAGDKARKSLVTAEVSFLKAQMEDFKKGGALMPPVLGLLGGFGGFQDIAQAMLVPGATEAGDRMEFSAEDGRHTVRLFGVRCMPVGSPDAATVKFFTSRFGISEDVAESLGPVAQEFTSGYLEGRIVRLLVQQRSLESDAEPPLALVFLPDIGLFQNILVDQGLAAVKEDEASRFKGSMPKAVIGGLKAREAAARERADPPGAWALRLEPGGGGR